MVLEIRPQTLDVRRSALVIADAVQLKAQIAQSERGVQPPLQCDQFGVERRVRFADALEVDLVELPKTTLLRLVVPKRVDEREDLDGLGSTGHPTLQIGAHNAGR